MLPSLTFVIKSVVKIKNYKINTSTIKCLCIRILITVLYRLQTTSATAFTISAKHDVDIGHKLTKISKKE